MKTFVRFIFRMQQREGLENRLVAEAVYKYKGKHNTKTNCFFFMTLKFPKLEKISKAVAIITRRKGSC